MAASGVKAKVVPATYCQSNAESEGEPCRRGRGGATWAADAREFPDPVRDAAPGGGPLLVKLGGRPSVPLRGARHPAGTYGVAVPSSEGSRPSRSAS